MDAKRHTPLSEIGKIYQTTKQGAAYLIAQHGYEVVTLPRLLLSKLLEGRASPLRTRLSDPDFLTKAEQAMETAPFRCAVRPPATRKHKSKP